MAAEVNEPTSVEAPAISDSAAILKINDDSQNGGSNPSSVIGTPASAPHDELSNKHIADIVDDLVNSAEPSISGGSDTEPSRLDAIKSKNGDKGHARTSSTTRKPATFKTVSVNKTFLATKAVSSSGASKPGDKASPTLGAATLTPSSSGSARPRLVAKTGLVKGVNANGRPAATPDPGAVWNKNRPVPVPEPRKLTDEELKKYGIHVATRLQQDDTKAQANNWADIDDDDEDWAPEEITWTDGTKSTIPHHEEQSQQYQPPAGLQLDPAHRQPLSEPVQPSPTAPMSVLSRDPGADEKPKSPAPSVVKTGGLPSGRGLILKGAPEKPTLVAKPPGPPTPVKSPWAQLPPVDKASPVVSDLHATVGGMRLPYHHPPPQQYHQHPPRDLYAGPPRGSTPPPHAYKEIAADDFSRGGFRDSQPHMNRELFNSQSGRLEPAPDRRGSFRSDAHYRQPPSALLQRSSHSVDQQAEPSPAFQTHRSGGQEGPYGRRRNSSNVSGGSGSFMQRIGRPHDQHVPPELLSARQPSLTGRSDSPVSPRNHSPSGPRSWQQRGSPHTAFATPHSNAGPPNSALQAPAHHGLPPPASAVPAAPIASASPAGPAAEVATATVGVDEVELQTKVMRERIEAAKKRRVEEEEREEAAKRERIRLKLEAMGPAPERKSAKKEAAKEDASAAAAAGAPVTPSQTTAKLIIARNEKTLPEAGGDTALHNAEPTQAGTAQNSRGVTESPKAENNQQAQSQQQAWQGPAPPPQTERIAPWGSASQSLRNLWGSPNNRSLGNGTFTSDLARVGEPYAQGGSPNSGKAGPGPIGPPPPAPIGPPKLSVLGNASGSGQALGAQPPTAPTTAASSSPGSTRSAWASAVKAGDESLIAQQKALRAEQQREAEARGLSLKDIRPTIKDTWMPTRMSDEGSRIEDKANKSVVQRPGNTVGSGGSPAPSIHPQQARPSRFFPARDARTDETGIVALGTALSGSLTTKATSSGRPGSPSPPPPDMDGHPVFDGDATHPLVSLPRPQIVVRLPPKDIAAAASSDPSHGHHGQSRHSMSHAGQTHPQTVSVDDGDWQARFNSLLKPGSPSKVSASSYTRHFVDNTTSTSPPSALQTAPKAPATRFVKPAPKEPAMTRPMAEECFERQEMGSLPPVRLPNKAPEHAWNPATIPKPIPRRFLLTATTSYEHDSFLKEIFAPLHSVHIHFPGMAHSGKTVNLPGPRTLSNPRRSGYGRSGRHSSSSHRGSSNKNRDTASTHSGSHGNDNGPSPSSNHGASGGRSRGGGMRHRSENWSRGNSAPVQT